MNSRQLGLIKDFAGINFGLIKVAMGINSPQLGLTKDFPEIYFREFGERNLYNGTSQRFSPVAIGKGCPV